MCGNGTYVTTDLTVITGTVLHRVTVITETGIKQCGHQVSEQINTFSILLVQTILSCN